MSHFVIKSSHFVQTFAFGHKTVAFCNKNPDSFFDKHLSHIVIKRLSYFVIKPVVLCIKLSS